MFNVSIWNPTPASTGSLRHYFTLSSGFLKFEIENRDVKSLVRVLITLPYGHPKTYPPGPSGCRSASGVTRVRVDRGQ